MAKSNGLPVRPTLENPRPFMLVVHRKGYLRTQLSRFKTLHSAVRAGSHRLIRGCDWFQIFQVEPHEVELINGTREANTVSISWTQSANKQIRAEAPLNWPDYLKKAKKEKRNGDEETAE